MDITISEFQREYLKAIREGYAAIFSGAGLSADSGYVNWKELLRDIAKDIKLDVEKENDLIAIAQYYFNERRGRNAINQQIINKFTKDSKKNRNIEILSQLPISTFWTTNYDSLLETELRANLKKVDIKITQDSLSTTLPERDAVIYKMHGDISNPADAVITKDDYESYNKHRQLFTTALQGDLVSKTFLFIGFSFQDPNLNYILSRIRMLLSKNQRTHYCFLKRVDRKHFESDKDFIYAEVKQEHQIIDLRRYGISAVMVNEYSDITKILENILNSHQLHNVFISGSANTYGEIWENKAHIFLNELSKRLVEEEFRLISGFGLGVGSFILSGALSEIMSKKKMDIEKYLCLRPFPHQEADNKKALSYNKYRESMISEAGISIFLFGNKQIDGKLENADGVIKEFEISRKQGKYLIPIGSTGYTALKIFDIIKEDSDNFNYLDGYWESLEKEQNIEILVETIINIIKRIIDSNENQYANL